MQATWTGPIHSIDFAQTARDHLKFIGGENPGAGESGRVRNGSSNIVVVETAIEGN